jgi:hypothetical protein
MSEQNGQSTAVATQPRNAAVEQIRQAGAAAVAEQKAVRDMYVMLEGVEWGSGNSLVKGADFSRATRAAFAKFCVVTRANPQIHVDLLGGKPYLNAQYYRDKCSADQYFIDDVQINISVSVAEQLRAQAKQALQEAKELGLPEPTGEVQKLLEEARTLDRLRSEYGVPEWATHAYETRIRRYVENAPLDAIRRGELADAEQFIRIVRECNWAGGRGIVQKKRKDGSKYEVEADPIGDAEPAKTARTRSFRRCARNAFSAWFDQFDDDISRASEVVEAEWTEVRDDNRERAAITSGETQTVVTGAGEPSAAGSDGARDLPIEDAEEVTEEPFTPEQKTDARRNYFGSLKAISIVGDDARKQWQLENNLGESSKEWGRVEYARAQQLLEPKIRERLIGVVGHLGFESIDDFARSKNAEPPTSVQHLKTLLSYALADAGES